MRKEGYVIRTPVEITHAAIMYYFTSAIILAKLSVNMFNYGYHNQC